VTEAIKKLSPAEQLIVSTQILAYQWYPYENIFQFGKLTRILGGKDEKIFIDVGRATARYLFSGAYKTLLVKDPIKQIEKFGWIEELFYKRTRTLEVEFKSKQECVLRRSFVAGVLSSVNGCEAVIGFWIQTLELSGAKNVMIAHSQCIVTKADFCEFIIQWE
jgi:predicted hydrocarbon binding protein